MRRKPSLPSLPSSRKVEDGDLPGRQERGNRSRLEQTSFDQVLGQTFLAPSESFEPVFELPIGSFSRSFGEEQGENDIDQALVHRGVLGEMAPQPPSVAQEYEAFEDPAVL